jgi:hypothetical protein
VKRSLDGRKRTPKGLASSRGSIILAIALNSARNHAAITARSPKLGFALILNGAIIYLWKNIRHFWLARMGFAPYAARKRRNSLGLVWITSTVQEKYAGYSVPLATPASEDSKIAKNS